ncbi:hypothetical protein D3C73_1158880 [compost metagenome]
MLLVLLKFNVLRQITLLSIHTDTNKSLLGDFSKETFMFALFAGNNRSQNLQSRLLWVLHNTVYHLLYGLRCDLDAMLRTMRMTNTREQKTQIVVDLSNGAYSGTRVAACRLLIN